MFVLKIRSIIKSFIVVLLFFNSFCVLASNVNLILATPLPPSNFHVKNLKIFVDEVKKETNGEVNITVHSGGDLGLKGPELLSSVNMGIVPMAEMLITQQVGDEPLFGLESVPYLARSTEELEKLHEKAWPYYENLASKNNQKFLYAVPWPGQGVFSRKPINDVKDLEGLKLRTVDQNGTEFFKSLGANPIQMPWGEVVPALATGAIDAVTTSSPSGVDGRFWEFVGYFNRLNWQMACNVVTINIHTWNSLTDEQKSKVEAVATKLQPKFWEASLIEDQRSVELLEKNGMTIHQPSETMADQITLSSLVLWDKFSSDVGDDAETIISGYRKTVSR